MPTDNVSRLGGDRGGHGEDNEGGSAHGADQDRPVLAQNEHENSENRYGQQTLQDIILPQLLEFVAN